MSTSWIAETRQSKDRASNQRERLSVLAADLANIWFREFVVEVEDEAVPELNRQYPENFNRELRSVPSVGNELRCGPHTVFEASLINGVILKVTRHKPTGKLGQWKSTPTHYVARLDHNERLFLESKSGQPIECDGMSQELFAYLTDPIG